MTTHTIEVTEIDEEMLQHLDRQIKQQKIQDRASYIREVLRHDLERRTRPAQEKTFAEILAPIQESVRESGMSEEEVTALFDNTLAGVRRERRNRKTRENV